MNEKIEPPKELEDALRRALNWASLDARANLPDNVMAEAILYSGPMQEWLRDQRPIVGTTPTTREAEEPIRVECKVRVPFATAAAAADVLSRVPYNATVSLNQGTGDGIARWVEER